MPTVFYGLQTAFTIWMMVDCYQRGAAPYWYLMLWVPFGPVIYFFVVKIHDFELRGLKRLLRFDRPASVETLRYRWKETATPANKLALAQALVQAKQSPEEAAALFGEVLRWESTDKRAQYGLALAQIQLGDLAAAADGLARLVEKDANFQDYDAWRQLAELHWQQGAREAAIAELEQLAQQTARVSHRVVLAKRLIEVDRKDDAKKLLETAVESYKHSPRYIQRRDARDRREARRLLKTLP